MSEWKECRLRDIIDIKHGYAFKGEFFTNEETENILLTPGNFRIGGGFKSDKLKFYGGDVPADYILKTGDVIVTMTDLSKGADTLGYSAVVPEIPSRRLLHNQRLGRVTCKSNSADLMFINWLLRTGEYRWHVIGSASGSTVSHTSPSRILEYQFSLPSLPEQRAIAGVLSSLDDKIDFLHRQNKTLEIMAVALWRKMFVEEADLGWISKSLGDFFPILTGKKDANYSTEDGQYPFFTCSRNTLKSPGYSFDGHAILLAGNGDFNLKRYKGKFEAYQRTYVLIPHNELEVGFLYYGMRQHLEDITMGYRGSVINFITKGMIENFQMLMMPDTSIFYEVCRLFNEINEKIDSNDRQVRTLSRLRDTLLTKLMSGEVRVRI